MKINGLKKSVPIIASLLISGLAFAFFVTHQSPDVQTSHPSYLNDDAGYTDTIPGKKQSTQDSVYNALISSADKFFDQKNYEKCLSELTKALQVKPQDQALRDRINTVKGLASTQKEQADASQKAIASGDAYFKNKDYLNAKSSYQLALSQNPNDETAKEKLRKTMELLRSQKAQNILFDVAVASADKLFAAGEYEKARVEYENAGKLLPGDPYPKNKINEIIKIQVDNKVKGEEYAAAIARADKFYNVKSYQDALLDYKKASAIKIEEKYPQDRITELTALIAAQKAKDDAYNKAIALADQAFKAIQYKDAFKSYKDALAVKPEQAYPKEKIKEIEAILARITNAQADYDKYVALADSFYIDKKYFKARENYVMASSAKPAEAYPREMISKADKMLTGQEAAMAKALEEQYSTTVAGADKLLAEKSFEQARAEYQKASNLKPVEQFPKDKIREIDNLLANLLKDKESQYQAAIAGGDMAFGNKVYELSRSEYQNALKIKPNEAYPKTRIAEIEKLMAADAQQKAADSKYANSIGKADSLFIIKEYLPAKNEFQKASNMKPAEVYPKNRINEINGILANMDKQKALDIQYAAVIAKADKLLADKSYTPAKTEYGNASTLKPLENYPKEKIAEIDKILAGLAVLKALDEQYTLAIAAADKQFFLKKYDDARILYQDALAVKAEEKYPKDKIAEIDKILLALAANKSLEEDYLSVIAMADKYFAAKSYEQAKSEYTGASALKPAEQYPKTKIAEIDAIFAAAARQKALEEQYANAILEADKLLGEKSYEPALARYQGALEIKPGEEYPKGKVAEIKQIMAGLEKLKSMEAQYKGAIEQADKLLAEKSYVSARAVYVNASAIKPEERYPQEKIASIDKTLADVAAAKALDDKYALLVANADKLLSAKSYDDARAQYQAAAGVKPAETYPAGKIAEIDKILADIAAAKSLDENYLSIVATADRHLGEKSYEAAKGEYAKASGLKPGEKYPVAKIAEIDAILAGIAKQKALDDAYAAAIASGDKLLGDKSYDLSKQQYQAALKLKAAEQYPKDKIAEIDKALAELALLKDRDEKYAASIASADKMLAQKSYAPARTEYQTASAMKPQEGYPKEKIGEIDAALASIAAAKALDEKYAGFIAGADKLLAAKTYDQARGEYQKAGDVKPAESYPKDKIAEIDKILADLAALKTLDENYNGTITKADKLLAAKSYDPARVEYVKASELKPAEQYPKGKIAEIDAALAVIARQKALDEEYATTIANADKLLGDKSYDLAKPQYQAALKLKAAEQYPKDKIAEIDKALAELALIKDRDDKYSAAIANGDKLLAEKSYAPARVEYVNASSLKPKEGYPKEKIGEIDAALAAIAAAKALDDKYAGIITGADKLLAAKTYDQARSEYQKAGEVKPAEAYPKDKIAGIDKILADLAALKTLEENYKGAIAKGDQLLAAKSYDPARVEYVKASELKPAEQYPKGKIAEIDAALAAIAKQKALDEEYAATIVNADKMLSEKSYETAKAEYQKASGLKAAEQYPKTKIAEIDKALADAARLKAIDDQYTAAISGADKLLAEKSYDQAKTGYTDAGKIKPSEKYPKDKILEINDILAGIAKQKALDEQYKTALAKADQLLGAKTYEQAKVEYTNALTLKPAEQYPKDKIAEIDVVLAELKAKEDAYKASLAAADQLLLEKKYEEARTEYQNSLTMKPQATYPKEKIGEINKALEMLLGKQKYYDNLIVDADNALKEKDYSKAKETYQQALGVFPAQVYPKSQVDRITARMDSLYRANKSFYDKAIADGDRFYNSYEFDKAVDAYTDAANFLPMEKYPREMIVKIRRTIAENAIADVLNSSVTIKSNDEKQFPFPPVNIASRKNNFVYIKIRNLSGKPFNVLVRYGKDKQPNGGVVMRNLNPDGKMNERLVSVKDQDLWSREDNNWISLYPQGGDVEVSFIQVSRAK
jgi:tetratricopeptide (TPR) repeat protein